MMTNEGLAINRHQIITHKLDQAPGTKRTRRQATGGPRIRYEADHAPSTKRITHQAPDRPRNKVVHAAGTGHQASVGSRTGTRRTTHQVPDTRLTAYHVLPGGLRARY